MRRFLLLLMLLCPSLAFAQGGILSGGIVVISSSGHPVAGATVTVCQLTDNGVPCTNTVSLFSDPALTISRPNPGVTDGNGNFVAFASAGNYKYTVTGNGVKTTGQPFTTTAALVSGGCFSAFNGIFFVGGACASSWGGGDIVAQMNAVKAAAPLTGATIYVIPQTGGGCYLTSGNTFVANTVGQVFDIKGVAPLADSNLQVIGGSCIQDTNTGAHSLFTFDWTPTGGGNVLPAGGIENLAVVNSSTNGGTTQCIAVGGCGSSAVVLSVGGTNAGAAASTYRKFYTGGFATGVKMQNTSGNSWGMSFYDSSWTHNSIGVDYTLDTTGHENDSFTNCKFSVNGTNIAMGTDTQISIVGGSQDSHVTAGITLGSGTHLSTTNVRWENLGTGNTATDMSFIVGSAGSQVHVTGGEILDDSSTGTSTQSYFTFDRGSVIGMDFFADASRTYTGTAFNCLSQCFIQIYNGSPTQFPVAGGGTTGNICPPLTCDPHIGAQNPYGNAFSQILTKSAANIGVTANSSVYYVRDNTSGGSVIVTVDNTGASVTLSGAAGTGITYVTGAPGASQIGFTFASGFLQIRGGSSTGSDVIRYTQTITQ